jgi:hypothetical protein
MGLKNVKVTTTTRPGGKAWPGDVGRMQLDINKIRSRGWNPKLASDGAVLLAAKELVQELI